MKQLVDRLQNPDVRVTVLTGAGVSAASGVPTFRGADGLWKNFRPEVLASADAFGRDPSLVWEWYAWRRFRISTCEPNAAHRVLAEWSKRFPHFKLITQNVDGLHEKAASALASPDHAQDEVIRLHGSLWEVSCWHGCRTSPKRWLDDTVNFATLPPRCPYCGGVIRPGVVWFGETLDTEVVMQAMGATHCDVFMTIGTSAVVYPAAGFLEQAKANGAFTVEINAAATPATRMVDLALTGAAEMVLPLLNADL